MVEGSGKNDDQVMSMMDGDHTWLFIQLPISRHTADISNQCFRHMTTYLWIHAIYPKLGHT